MKNLFAATFLILTLSFSSVSFAGSNPATTKSPITTFEPVVFMKSQATKLDVLVKEAANSKLTIRLLDSQGNTLATKVVGKNVAGTRIRFDLASLADGAYQIKVTDGKNTQVQNFNLAAAVPVPANRSLSLG